MSHFLVSVLVSEDTPIKMVDLRVDEALAPYDEDLDCEPYVRFNKEIIIEETKEKFSRMRNNLLNFAYANSMAKDDAEALQWFYESNPHHQTPYPDELVYIPKVYDHLRLDFNRDLTDEDFWKMACTDEHVLNHYAVDQLENGVSYSTYNPNSKWDWYAFGGRWEDYITDECVKNTTFYRKHKFVRLEDLKVDASELSYAFLDLKGEWREPGEMGWFGMSTSTPETEADYRQEIQNYLEDLSPQTWICFVDCHI